MRIEYFQSMANGQWYFHIKARNNKIVAQSEGYKAKRSCVSMAKRLRTGLLMAFVSEIK